MGEEGGKREAAPAPHAQVIVDGNKRGSAYEGLHQRAELYSFTGGTQVISDIYARASDSLADNMEYVHISKQGDEIVYEHYANGELRETRTPATMDLLRSSFIAIGAPVALGKDMTTSNAVDLIVTTTGKALAEAELSKSNLPKTNIARYFAKGAPVPAEVSVGEQNRVVDQAVIAPPKTRNIIKEWLRSLIPLRPTPQPSPGD